MPAYGEAPRAVHIIMGLGRGGAEYLLLEVLKGRDPSRLSHHVICLGPEGPMAEPLRECGVEVHAFGLSPSLPSPLMLLRLARLLGRLRPRIVQGWLYHGNLVAALMRAPAVLWGVYHSLDGPPPARLSTRLCRRLCVTLSDRPRAIVYDSWRGRRQHEGLGYPADRGRVISNGVDTERFRPDRDTRARVREELGLEPGCAVVGNVARFHPLKDHATLLAAFGEVAQRHPACRFLLAGSGVSSDNPWFREALRAAGLEGRALLLGERADIARLLTAMDVFCLSSVAEAGPIALAEALSAGLPCAATDVGDVAALVAGHGSVVPPRRPEALAASIDRLLALTAEQREAIGGGAREHVRASYSLAAMLQRYHGLYDELLGRSG